MERKGSSVEVSDSVGQCRVGSHDRGDEEEKWGPNGEKESFSYWELSFETKTVVDSGAIKKVTFYPSLYRSQQKLNVYGLNLHCGSGSV